MRKLSLLAAAFVVFSPMTQADTIGFEIGGYRWMPNYSGQIAVDDGAQQGTQLDLEDDLGFDNENHNILWLALEHPVPFLPNLKIVSSDLDVSASSVLSRTITFGGSTFVANENVSTRIDFSNTEFTLYYELLDNWINLDAGVTLRKYNGKVVLNTDPAGSNISESEKLDFVIPLGYLKGRIDLPLTGLFVDGQINIISISGDSISDTEVSLGYETEIGFGAKAGYRIFNMDIDENDFVSDLEFSGAYVSLFYHF